MLEGLPSLFEYVIGVVTRQRQRGSLAVVLYHLLGDVVNAAEHALIHYFPLTLSESFLQNSSIGTPYQKWAKFTNEDFQNVDQCLRRLIPAAWEWYDQTINRPLHEGGIDLANPESWFEKSAAIKDAWHWFHVVKTEYTCCFVNSDEPALTLSAINLNGWVDWTEGRFLNVCNRPPWDPPQRVPPIITKSVRDIADRSAVTELQRVGLARLEELREANGRFAGWLRANYTMEEITAPHRGTLSGGLLG
jgi:hypothetical protein